MSRASTFLYVATNKDVDGRNKSGHDVGVVRWNASCSSYPAAGSEAAARHQVNGFEAALLV
jgi:hypothetical protein